MTPIFVAYPFLAVDNEPDLKQAIDHFERAIQIEPHYAAAYAALSQAWSERGVWGALCVPETEAPQRAAARKALELDDGMSASHVAWWCMKATRDWDWAAAESEYDAPSSWIPATSRHGISGKLLMAIGRHAGAIAEMKRRRSN